MSSPNLETILQSGVALNEEALTATVSFQLSAKVAFLYVKRCCLQDVTIRQS